MEMPSQLAGQHIRGLVAADRQQQIRIQDAGALQHGDIRGVSSDHPDIQGVSDPLKFGLFAVQQDNVVARGTHALRQHLPEFACSNDDNLHGVTSCLCFRDD